MENQPTTHTRPVGVLITLDQILEKVNLIDTKIDNRLRKIENQIAAMWVTHGIMITSIVVLITERIKQ